MKMEYTPDLASVIITTYQRADYIVKTVNSVFHQDYRPIELIVIDDGSIDNTKECLDIWINSLPVDNLFKLIYHYQNNTGAPAARNFALSISSGEFIQEIGSDDLIHPNKLSIHINALKTHKHCESAWSPLKRFKNDEEKYLFKKFDGTENIEVRKKNENVFEPQFLPSAGLHRRSTFYNSGPWMEPLKRWQDLEYQTRMALSITHYIVVDEPMYFFRQHDGVRINSMYKSASGIEPGFLALKVIENTLNYVGHKDIVTNIEISNFYVTLATLSAENNYFKGIRYAIAGATRNRRDIFFLLRMKVFLIISFLFGGITAYRIGRIYQKIREQ